MHTIEPRQNLNVACLEEIAFQRGFIDASQLEMLARQSPPELKAYLEYVLAAS